MPVQGKEETRWCGYSMAYSLTDVLEVAFGLLASGLGLFSFRVKGDQERGGGNYSTCSSAHTRGSSLAGGSAGTAALVLHGSQDSASSGSRRGPALHAPPLTT